MILPGDILAVLVCYKTDYRQCSSWKSLQRSHAASHMHWLVYDNSPASVTPDANVHYEHHPENRGVSAAYQRAAALAASRSLSWILLLDQDSVFPDNWFESYKTAMEQHPEQVLFVPRIPAEAALLSPSRLRLGRTWPAKPFPTGSFSLYHYAPINAGMMVSTKAYVQTGGHDEQVQLDFSDLAFLHSFRKSFPQACLCDFDIAHQLSGAEKANQEQRLQRFRQYCRDATAFLKADGPAWSMAFWTTWRALLLSFRYRSLNFFNVLLRDFRI
jgi:GT2 family glycosyltransferase